MKIKATNIDISYSRDKKAILQLTAENRLQAELLFEESKNFPQIDVEIKKYRNKRSLNANGYMWELLRKMAVVLKKSKDEVYLDMLDRYGIFTHIVVKPNMVDRVKAGWKTVRELGETIVNGKKGIQLQCYFGSSTYDSKEFSVLLDGIVSEAKELDIETLDDIEYKRMMSEYEKGQ